MANFFSNLFTTRLNIKLEILKSNHIELQGLQNRKLNIQLDKNQISFRYDRKPICIIPRHDLLNIEILNGNATKLKQEGSVIGGAIGGFIVGRILIAMFSENDLYSIENLFLMAVTTIVGTLAALNGHTEYVGIQRVLKFSWKEYGVEQYALLHLEYEDANEIRKKITEYFRVEEPLKALPQTINPETLQLMNELELLNEKGVKLLSDKSKGNTQNP